MESLVCHVDPEPKPVTGQQMAKQLQGQNLAVESSGCRSLCVRLSESLGSWTRVLVCRVRRAVLPAFRDYVALAEKRYLPNAGRWAEVSGSSLSLRRGFPVFPLTTYICVLRVMGRKSLFRCSLTDC